MATVFANLGANIGPRRLNLSKAATLIGREFGEFELSHAVESEPWGFDSANSFLNIGIAFSSDRRPDEILAVLQDIERKISPSSHRDADGRYADREIDIDIVAIDDLVIDTETLKVPHPHLNERRFFLEPLNELAPNWRHPISGLSPLDMLYNLAAKEN